MKKLIFFLLGSIVFPFSLIAQAPDWGIADTLEHHPLGPGIQYSKIFYRDRPILLWMVSVDLTNQHNKIEQVQSRHQVPDVLRWTVPEHSINNTYPGHKVCAAFNHDFFVYEAGVCIGVNVSEGEIPYGSGWGRSLLAISEDNMASVFYPQLDAAIVLPDGSAIKIDHYNSLVAGLVGDCILFNRMNSRVLAEAGKYIKIKPLTKWTVNGDDVPCTVLEIADTPLQTSQTEYVIYLQGAKINAVDGKLNVGDEIKVSQKFVADDSKFGEPLQNIVAGFHGYPSIAYEGKLHDGEYNNFENGREYEISSRTMAGISQDGKTLYLVVTEMSGVSKGVDCIDIANWMLAHGSWNVVNFDSGGSAAIAVNHEMLNVPGRGSIRPVEDALLAVSTAPESTQTHKYSFLTPGIYPSAVSLTPLTLMSFNEYDEVLEKGIDGFTFKCIPEDLGWIDEEYVFHAGTKSQTGKIVAEKNGLEAELAVHIREVSGIRAFPPTILIDGIREFPIRIEGYIGNELYTLDPDAFTWSSSNPECCSVNNGVVKGISNGTTELLGKLNDLEISVRVTVEIGKNTIVHADFSDMATWDMKLHASVVNLRFENADLPLGWEDGINMLFDINSGRALYIDIQKPITFYSLPDSISFQMLQSDAVIKEVYLNFSSNTVSGFKQIIMTPTSVHDSVYVIPFSEAGTNYPVSDFPLQLDNIKVYLKAGVVKKDVILSWRDLKAYYPTYIGVGINEEQKAFQKPSVSVVGDNAVISYSLSEAGPIFVSLWDIEGMKIVDFSSDRQMSGEYSMNIPLGNLNPGVYLVRVVIGAHVIPLKFIIK